jgi:hypothetical protein
VVAITALQLANVENWRDLYNTKLCKASADPTNSSVCTYIYAVGAVSVAMTIIIGLMQVCAEWEGLSTLAAAVCQQQCYNTVHACQHLRAAQYAAECSVFA